MSIESQMLTTLQTALGTLAGGRVYNEELPQDCDMPAAVFMRIATMPENGLEGHLGIDLVRVQVSSWADAPAAAETVAAAVRTAMTGAPLNAMMVMETQFKDPDVQLSCRVQDYYIWD